MLCTRVQTRSLGAQRAFAPRRARAAQPTQALFGFGKSKKEVEEEKEEQYRAQLELLKERRSGKLIEKANERRAGVRTYLDQEKAAREKAYREGKNVELPGRPKILTKDQYGTDSNSGIVIPLIPVGIPKFDNGERFDLKGPFADKGYVDPNDDGGFVSGWKKLFGGKEKKQDKQDKKKN